MSRVKPFAFLLGALTLAAVLLAPARNAAAIEVGLKGMFGFGGEMKIDDNGVDTDDDMEPTAGLGLYGSYELLPFLDVGAQAAFLWYQTEGGDDANLDPPVAIDLGVLLRPEWTFLGGKLDVYAAIPLGISIYVPSDDVENATAAKTGFGIHAGVLPGVTYRFWGGLGAFVEVGWMLHWGKADKKGGGDYSILFNQFAMDFGVSYEF
jgi:hypothetical protein